jgi:hypothetical protein
LTDIASPLEALAHVCGQLPPSAARALRRRVSRQVVVGILWLTVGLSFGALDGPTLWHIAILRQRGLPATATVTSNDFKGYGWTELDISFETATGKQVEVFGLAHEGEVKQPQVAVVYDPQEPTIARLAADIQAGALAVEAVDGVIAFVGESDSDSQLTGAVIGLLLVVIGVRRMAMAAAYRRRLLRLVRRPPVAGPARMWLRADGDKNSDAIVGPPDDHGQGDWFRVPLVAGQDLKHLTEPGMVVEALHGAGPPMWLAIRTPDGRLLLPKDSAERLPAGAAPDSGRAPTEQTTTVMTAATPSLSCLLYLSADEVVGLRHGWRIGRFGLPTGTKVPCKDTRVATRELQTTILAAAFVHLRDAGSVSLELVRSKERGPQSGQASMRLSVMLVDDTEQPGLPGALLRATRPYGDRLGEIFTRMLQAPPAQGFAVAPIQGLAVVRVQGFAVAVRRVGRTRL